MEKSTFVYATYIRTTPQKLWKALISPMSHLSRSGLVVTGSLALSNTAVGCMRWMMRRVAPVANISSVVPGSYAGCVLV